jgi:hypothetical protein
MKAQWMRFLQKEFISNRMFRIFYAGNYGNAEERNIECLICTR